MLPSSYELPPTGWFVNPDSYTRQREAEMGFLFYASFVRFVLEGAYTHVLMERARVWMKAAGMAPQRD